MSCARHTRAIAVELTHDLADDAGTSRAPGASHLIPSGTGCGATPGGLAVARRGRRSVTGRHTPGRTRASHRDVSVMFSSFSGMSTTYLAIRAIIGRPLISTGAPLRGLVEDGHMDRIERWASIPGDFWRALLAPPQVLRALARVDWASTAGRSSVTSRCVLTDRAIIQLHVDEWTRIRRRSTAYRMGEHRGYSDGGSTPTRNFCLSEMTIALDLRCAPPRRARPL